MKPRSNSPARVIRAIEEKNPLKQGLKQCNMRLFLYAIHYWREESIKTRIETRYSLTNQRHNNNWREESIKTRIETGWLCPVSNWQILIEEKNPLKQGLKPCARSMPGSPQTNWREESIKTRIETCLRSCRLRFL